MATIGLNPVTSASWRKTNGLYPVRIRVTFKGKARTLGTTLLADKSQLTRTYHVKDAALLDNVQRIIADMRSCLAQLSFFDIEAMDIEQLVDFLKKGRGGFALDFPTYAESVIASMGAGAKNYASALRSLTAYVGLTRYDIGIITSSLLTRYQSALEEKHGKTARAVSLYTNCIAYIHARARAEYNDYELGVIRINNPFAVYKCPKQRQAPHRNTSPALIDLMLYYRKSLTGRERLGVDVFLLSFALMGMNAPDLYKAAAPSGSVITYNRTKTEGRRIDKAEMRVRVEPCCQWLLDEYKGKGGHCFNFSKRYSSYTDLSRAVNIGLKQFAQRLGIDCPLTLYVARHTWATVASSQLCGIDKSVVNDCICHVDSSMRVTDIYVAKDWARVWDANKRVQSLFAWAHDLEAGQ